MAEGVIRCTRDCCSALGLASVFLWYALGTPLERPWYALGMLLKWPCLVGDECYLVNGNMLMWLFSVRLFASK